MSEFIASAEIAIIPNTKGFRNLLIAELGAMKEVPVPVKVVPDTKAFRKELLAVLSNMKVPPVMVPVKPNMVGFEKDLRTRVKAIADRVSANVKVTAGAARQTGTGGGTRTRRPTPVLSDTGKPLFGAAAAAKTEARAREKEQLAAIEKIQKKEIAAHAQNLKLDKARTAADLAARQAALAELEKQGLLSSTGRPLTGAARDAKLEANARVKANADALKQMRADEIAAHRQDIIETRRIVKAQNALRTNALRGQAGVLDDPARVAARAQAERALANARKATTTIDDAAIGAETRLEAARAKEAAAQTLAISTTKARRAAEAAGLKTTAAAVAVEEKLAFQRLTTAQANVRAAVAEETLTKRRAFGVRGAVAQLATFAGLRGAVLSANAAFIAGTVAAIAFGKAIQGAARFESELNVFAVTARATASEMERVSAEAEKLGRDITLPGVSAQDAAEAMASLSRAGLDVEDSLAGARGVLQLATAAAISNAEATELAASAINAFGLAGEDATRVADVLANSANLAQGSITDVAIAMQQASAVARQVGVSFEDTVALLTLLARNGIRGSDAGTSLRVAFTRLIAPTKDAAAVLKQLNVEVRDAQGNLRPEVFSDIARAQQDLSRATQDANAKIIFGVDALRAYSIISREGLSTLGDTRVALNRQGSAAELAGARMEGLTGATENLKNQLAALGLSIGQVLVPPLTLVTDGLALFFGSINTSLDLLDKFTLEIIDLGRAIDDLPTIKLGPIDLLGFDDQIAAVIRGIAVAFEEPFEPAGKSLNEILDGFEKAQEDLDNLKRSGDFIPPKAVEEVNRLRKALAEVGKQRLASGNSNALAAFVESFAKRAPEIGRAMKDNVITPLEKSQIAATELGKGFLAALPDRVFVQLGADIRSGVEDASREGVKGIDRFGPDLRSAIEDQAHIVQGGIHEMAKSLGDTLRADLTAAFFGAIASVNTSLGRLELEQLELEAAGAPRAALQSNIEKQIADQDRIIARARDRLAELGTKQDPASKRARQKATNILKEALRSRKSLVDESEGLAEEAARETKEAADKITKSLNDADEDLLASFAPAERRVERRATIAEGTPGLQDDIAAARSRKQQLLKQIAVIRADFNDRKAAADEIAARRQEILEIEQKIANDTKASRDQITETLGKRIELAQLQGGRGAILKAIDNAIKDAKNRVKNWKRLGLVLLDEQIELARLVKSRKEFLNDLTGGESPDVFVDRLFREAVDQFRRFGSNISTGGGGIISPQGARGQFASILTGNGQNVTNLTENTAQRTRNASLEEEKKQTTYLRIIAGGPRTKFVKGAPIPPEATKVARDIADNVLSGL